MGMIKKSVSGPAIAVLLASSLMMNASIANAMEAIASVPPPDTQNAAPAPSALEPATPQTEEAKPMDPQSNNAGSSKSVKSDHAKSDHGKAENEKADNANVQKVKTTGVLLGILAVITGHQGATR